MNFVIGLGSNLGDRRAQLAQAVREMGSLGRITAVSQLYETRPVGPPQPMFLNGAVRLASELAPEPLLDGLLAIEQRLGRVRLERWGPRLIDLDILWSDFGAWQSARLCIPHPELRKRAFALRPLLDVAPDATDPRDGVPYLAVLSELAADSAVEIATDAIGWT